MKRKIINPWTWQDKYGFVQANEISEPKRVVYTAGIVSVDENGELLHPNNMEKQIEQIFDNLECIFKEANMDLSNVIRFKYYTTDVNAFKEAGIILAKRMQPSNCKPATTLLGVQSLFHPDCVVEIEATLAA